MINEITIEGIITCELWNYDKDIFFRIASYRNIDLPAKPSVTHCNHPLLTELKIAQFGNF